MSDKDVPYVVFEGAMARLERTIEKLWILAIILIVLFVGSNCAWLYYENQFENATTTVMQKVDAQTDGDSDLKLTTIGGDYGGGESENQTDGNN